jgi:hypothetical protein
MAQLPNGTRVKRDYQTGPSYGTIVEYHQATDGYLYLVQFDEGWASVYRGADLETVSPLAALAEAATDQITEI